MQTSRRSLLAYVLPLGAFLAFLGLKSLATSLFPNSPSLLLAHPEYWVYPLQSVVCGGLLLFYWKEYDFGPLKSWYLGVLAGLIVLIVWISPQAFLGFAARTDGFNPELLRGDAMLYYLTVLSRFARLVIIVPLVEEIFWRGFLMRYLIKEDFKSVPFGTFSPLAFFGVAVLFMLEHTTPDYPAALFTGLLWNGLAIRTKSLFACVMAHAVANLGLGLYVMKSGQWGFW